MPDEISGKPNNPKSLPASKLEGSYFGELLKSREFL
jgi:hypothetical protein